MRGRPGHGGGPVSADRIQEEMRKIQMEKQRRLEQEKGGVFPGAPGGMNMMGAGPPGGMMGAPGMQPGPGGIAGPPGMQPPGAPMPMVQQPGVIGAGQPGMAPPGQQPAMQLTPQQQQQIQQHLLSCLGSRFSGPPSASRLFRPRGCFGLAVVSAARLFRPRGCFGLGVSREWSHAR